MPFLIFDSKEDAEARSREAWELVLGRKKRPQDVTELLWAVDIGKDGRAALVISEETDKLTAQEAAALASDLQVGKGENWEKPDLPLKRKTDG